jgi:hypothetical protein
MRLPIVNARTAMLVVLLLAAACAPKAPEEVVDVNMIRTQAVETAMMDMTVQAVLHPTITPVPATQTPMPSATAGSPQAPNPPTSSSGGGSSSGGSAAAAGTAFPTSTPDVYICEFITQNPSDKPQMTGADYDMTWSIRNIGGVTWTKANYYVKWLGGTDLSPQHSYPLPYDVLPKQTLDVTVDIKIPTQPSSALMVTRWGIVNDNGEVFCKFFHAIPSTYPPQATATPAE